MRRPLVVFATAVLWALALAPEALAQAPGWHVYSEALPSYLPPEGKSTIFVVASNIGDGTVSGSTEPVRITDTLPEGLTATEITGPGRCSLETLQCTYTGSLIPYAHLTVTIKVAVGKEPEGTVLSNRVSVEGGGAPRSASVQHVTLGGETPFGIQDYELSPLGEDGSPATQAGSHPFALVSTLVMNQTGVRVGPDAGGVAEGSALRSAARPDRRSGRGGAVHDDRLRRDFGRSRSQYLPVQLGRGGGGGDRQRTRFRACLH